MLYIKINPRIERLARQYGHRLNDVINTPAGFQGMGHYLFSDGIVEFFCWPFPPFKENDTPTNSFVFDDFTARINLNLNLLESQRSLDNRVQGW